MKHLKYTQIEEGMDIIAFSNHIYGRYIVILHVNYVLGDELHALAYYHMQTLRNDVQTRTDSYPLTLEWKYLQQVEWFQLNDEEVQNHVVAELI